VSGLIALLLLAPVADDAPNPYLVQARELYEQLDFEKCLMRVKQAQGWKTTSTVDLRDVELYGGLCALNLGNRDEAVERFKLALRIDPNANLPELVSPKAVKLFTWVKRNLRGPVPPMPDEDLPEYTPLKADRPLEVTAAWRFPVKPLPLVLAGVGLLGLVTGIALGAAAKGAEGQAQTLTFESDYLDARSRALGLSVGANVAYGLAAAAAVAALIFFFVQRGDGR
jgi:hypothetical protein